jgi:hypothetical protein
MKTLTGMGGLGNAQELAELLRQMGRGPDSMLAHITPEEAQMLLQSGGSGRMNPMTGLPEFQPEPDPASFEDYIYNQPQQPLDPSSFEDYIYNQPQQPLDPSSFEDYIYNQPQPQYTYDVEAQPGGSYGQMQRASVPLRSEFVGGGAPIPMVTANAVERYNMGRGQLATAPAAPASAPPQQPVSPQQQQSFKEKYPMLSQVLRSNLFATGLASLPAAYFAGRARREGRGAESELRAMAQPIREQAEALRQQALTGGLTPQQARQEEARRASMRQAASTRNATSGTQKAMIENTLARERSGLAQTNLENAMRQLNLANTVTEAAIRARLASDRDVDRYLSNIYTNLIRTASGGQGNVQQPQGMTGQQILPEQRLFEEPSAKR